jgi:hypothetical protein
MDFYFCDFLLIFVHLLCQASNSTLNNTPATPTTTGMMQRSWRVAFFGSDSVSLPVLRALVGASTSLTSHTIPIDTTHSSSSTITCPPATTVPLVDRNALTVIARPVKAAGVSDSRMCQSPPQLTNEEE